MAVFSKILQDNNKLQDRMNRSRIKLGELRSQANNYEALQNDRLSVFAAGSLGRLETGEKSDFDVFMICDSEERRTSGKSSVSRLEEYEVFSALIRINEDLNYPKFSGDGRFLKTYELQDMIKATGSPQDDSENLFTARMLLLLESQPVTNEELYQRGTALVVENYFRDGLGRDNFRPLFLMNDLLRYWRTLCLNYEVYRNEPERPWLKKSLNLKFSRKLTIFSTVLSLLAGRASDSSAFLDLCNLTPIERLADALDAIDDPTLEKGFSNALGTYESFLKAKEIGSIEFETTPTFRKRHADLADRFGRFLHEAFDSHRIDGDLRRYVLI
ncbi:hypothetical protein [Variovorax arabinosiphilus]|uniref:hypothetical protein n=1 Tax=Variovorax arabinosiphilus TaxID=3053498 RepID=UPI0025758427|nr:MULTISPECIES: hypothetical protein [unclassified Variovorax]MDM0122632.1 hypothetical protein [Variovorax sp. J2L1-78]MDM0132371.1 hypothetical protein [Variovorax sp. J2L1-63]MDM0235396.1 hypothetical protein [Variovorax sp. J2R1-6]